MSKKISSAMSILSNLVGPNRDETVRSYALRRDFKEEPFPGGVNYVLYPEGLENSDPKHKCPSTLLVAHHDRVPRSPGANDNGAAVAQLLYAAENGWNSKGSTLIALVDKEEPGPTGRIATGSRELKNMFDNRGFNFDHVIVFDVTGKGNMLVLSTAGPTPATSTVALLQNKARSLELAFDRCQTPPSDNVSFPDSALISLLPEDEIHLSGCKPTWKTLHSPDDSIKTVDSQSMELMVSFMASLMK